MVLNFNQKFSLKLAVGLLIWVKKTKTISLLSEMKILIITNICC